MEIAANNISAPKGWPKGVWLSEDDAVTSAAAAGYQTPDASGDLKMSKLLSKLLTRKPELADKALANMKPHVIDQVRLRVEHADALAAIMEKLKKKRRATEVDTAKVKKPKKRAMKKLPAKFLTAEQEVM
jgi:hypothetical protein